MGWLCRTNGGVILTVKAVPRASKTEVAGADAEWLRVRIQAPPADGKANAELAAFLAKRLGIPKSAVTILSGGASRLKRIRLDGVPPEAAAALAGGGGTEGKAKTV